MVEIREISMIIVVASISLAISYIPAFPIIGFQGFITLGALAGVINGLYLGLRRGLYSVVIVLALTALINPGIISLMGPFYPLPLVIGWITSSLAYRYGPIVSYIPILISAILFIIVNYFAIARYLNYLFFDTLFPIALIAIYVFRGRIGLGKRVEELKTSIAVSYGVVGDHLGGSIGASLNILYLQGYLNTLLNNPEQLDNWCSIWSTVAYIYPVERILLIIIGILVVQTPIAVWRRMVKK